MGHPKINEPHPGPDLATQSRPVNEARLIKAALELEKTADVAYAKLIRSDVQEDWLRALAADEYGGVPSDFLVRWINVFSDHLEIVRRARNNIIYREPLDDNNVAAAAQIAERLLEAAQIAGRTAMQGHTPATDRISSEHA